MLNSCLLHYLLLSDSAAMEHHKVSSLDTSFFKNFTKKTKFTEFTKKTKLCLIILRVKPLGLALLYRYYSLTLENILVHSFLLLL